jgi:catechol 2,3-dioxygenase-like lactoylglutathione lyase family enzyme
LFTHIFVGANDLDASKAFYDATLGVIGVPPGVVAPKARIFYDHPSGGARFGIIKPRNGDPATYGNGCTIGFAMGSTEQVDAWYAAGIANGGTMGPHAPCEMVNAQGVKVYAGYLRDPVGNKLCAQYIHR